MGPGVGKQSLNAELSCKHNNDTNSRENTVFHVKLMFPHKPLFIWKNEEQSLSHVGAFVT